MKKIISALLSLLVMASSVSAFAYTDCDNESVTKLTDLKVVDGYEDGTFKPDALLSRAEFSRLVSVMRGGTAIESEAFRQVDSAFDDMDNSHWAFGYVMYCNINEMINGYEDGTFRPEENISLAEALKICLSAIGYHQLIEENNGEWYVPWINMALKYGLIDNDSVDPDTKISRVEAADLIYRTMNLPLCIVTGYGFSNGVPSTILDFADGNERPFRSLLTENFQ